jgi:putative ABC transport system permease protein
MLKLAWKNIISNPFGSILSISLVALSAGMVLFFAHVNRQFQQTMENNTAGVHLILAAKGSPLQSVLCNLYHVDNPTGNITINEVKAFFNPKHPLIDKAIPLSIGDSYRSHRIVGTTQEIKDLYHIKLTAGKWWNSSNEVVVGAQTAKELSINLGDQFQSSHGLIEDGMDHKHEGKLTVTGILERSGSVIDNLILTSFKTIWDVHAVHDDHDHDHDHTVETETKVLSEREELLSNPDKEITSVLLTFKNHNHQTLNMMRAINENSTIQAAHPAWELNRLYSMVGTGTEVLKYLAWLIGAVSVISIFLSLLQSLRARKYELALLRVLGAKPQNIFALIIMEGLIQVVLGVLIGLIMAHIGLYLVDYLVADAYRYHVQAWHFGDLEALTIGVALTLGVIAALWPAIVAYRTDVSKTLQGA